jgi:hypothetical protein
MSCQPAQVLAMTIMLLEGSETRDIAMNRIMGHELIMSNVCAEDIIKMAAILIVSSIKHMDATWK